VKIVVIAVGKMRHPGLKGARDDYAARVAKHGPYQEIEVKDDAALERAIPAGTTVVACEVDGAQYASQAFSRCLEDWTTTGKGIVTFVIGGAEGIPKLVSEDAREKLSLSPMTLPHQLARVVLLEQIYRAFTILRGEPYARE
jgi:23S rRNA (pseudouridine1915-N3)-methyltransferase